MPPFNQFEYGGQEMTLRVSTSSVDFSDNSCGHTIGFYPGKIVLPGKNFPW